MSGIVGILNRDQAPIDKELLSRMSRLMSFHGPDAQEVWLDGAAGLGHALLRTTRESLNEQQPCSLDGQVWITADARIDGRAELIGKLESAGRRDVRQANDPQLILHAYQVWAEKSLDHLIGDFAFIIWDSRRRFWFGARDQLGVKPFYYAEAGRSLLCSNTLKCLQMHPGVSRELNDLAIADFLLVGTNQDPSTTLFAGIQRLPPAHSLRYSEGALRIQRYWDLPVRSVRYKRTYDYVEHFRELFGEAVKDRLRTDAVTVFMSGGADSTLVAAVAHQALGKPSGRSGVRAHTMVFDSLIPDEERKYSQLAADFIPIPIDHLAVDRFRPFADHIEWQFSMAEPESYALAGAFFEEYRQASAHSRIALTGFGGDPVLYTDAGYIREYLKPGALGKLLVGVGWCLWACRRAPRLGLRSLLRKFAKEPKPFRPAYPAWLNPDLEKRYGLAARSERIFTPLATCADGRSSARQLLLAPFWHSVFETRHPGNTGFPLEQRHPFFDLRLATFLVAIPPLPWCQEKNMLKAAGRGILPDAVRLRPKTPLVGDPVRELFRNGEQDWWSRQFSKMAPELARYATPEMLPRTTARASELETDLRLVALNHWLEDGRNFDKMLKIKEIVEV